MSTIQFIPGTSGGSSGFSPFSPIVEVASLSGATLDCDLVAGTKIGGGTATDNTTALNATISGASATSPKELLIDGASLAQTIFIPVLGNASIEGTGWDTGFYTKTGTNGSSINNKGTNAVIPFDPGGAAPTTRGQNVRLANFRISGNRGNGTNGNCTDGDPRWPNGNTTVFATGIDLAVLDYVDIDHLRLDDIATYAIRLTATDFFNIRNCYFSRSKDYPSMPFNTDGIHIDGPFSNGGIIEGCTFESGDDSIAINLPEGYGGNGGDIIVIGNKFRSCYDLSRLYTTSSAESYILRSATFANNTGSYTGAVFLLGLYTPSTGFGAGEGAGVANSIGSFKAIGNNSAGAPVYAAISTNIGYCEFANEVWQTTVSVAYGAIPFYNGATVATMRFNGFNVVNAGGGAVPYLFDFTQTGGGTITHLIIDSLCSDNITTHVRSGNWGSVALISGAGVLATGWEFPDALMAIGTTWISATGGNAGKVCTKNASGTVIVIG